MDRNVATIEGVAKGIWWRSFKEARTPEDCIVPERRKGIRRL